MVEIVKISIYLTYFSTLIPLLYLLVKKNTEVSRILTNLLALLLCASICSDLIGYIYIKLYGTNKLVLNIFLIAEFFLLSCIYGILLDKNKQTIYLLLFFFIVFFIVDSLYIETLSDSQTWPLIIESVLVIFYSLGYYAKLFKKNIDLLKSFSFWLNTAVFFYFAFDLFLFAIVNYIFKNMSYEAGMAAWGYHNLNNTIKNILFTVAISYAGIKQSIKPTI